MLILRLENQRNTLQKFAFYKKIKKTNKAIQNRMEHFRNTNSKKMKLSLSLYL